MSVRDDVYRDIQRLARARNLSTSEWTRQVLLHECDIQSEAEMRRKLEVIHTAAKLNFPTAEIDQVLQEIEQGYLSRKKP